MDNVICTNEQINPLRAIVDERERQEQKWGQQDHDDAFWLAILTEEVGEVAQAICQGRAVTSELIQTAAVAVAWMECLSRRLPPGAVICPICHILHGVQEECCMPDSLLSQD